MKAHWVKALLVVTVIVCVVYVVKLPKENAEGQDEECQKTKSYNPDKRIVETPLETALLISNMLK